MTNLENIRHMNIEELAKLLNHFTDGFDQCVVNDWFNNKYCEGICKDINVTIDGKNEKWKECYFELKCPYQNDWGKDMIKLWLDGEKE